MNDTKVILLCGNRIALPVMRDLVFSRQLAVVVIPEHCNDFIQQVQILLKTEAIPVLTVNKNDHTDKLQKAIKDYGVNLGLMATFSFKITAAVYSLPAKGFYNVHPGPLPEYRGPDPVFRQMIHKLPYAVISIHKLDDHFDTGPVVITDKIRLLVTDTYGMLITKLGELAARIVNNLLKLAELDIPIPSRPQDLSKAMYYEKQGAADVSINWQTMDADSIIALTNACNPWNKGAATRLNHLIIRFLSVEKISVETAHQQEPGTILSMENDMITVAAINGESVIVRYLHTEEGFFSAGKLLLLGVRQGHVFQ